MSRTLSEVFSEVRDYLDLDETDMSATVMLHWAKKGFDRINRQREDWPGYQHEDTITTSADQQTYTPPFEGVITQIFGQSGVLPLMGQNEAERRYGAGFNDNSSGEPQAYSVYDGLLFLWPIPNGTYVYSLRGETRPVFDTDITTTPTLPTEEAHELLLDYVLSEAQIHQDDFEKGTWWKQEFETGLKELAESEGTAPAYEPTIMNGRRTPNFPVGARFPGSNFPA